MYISDILYHEISLCVNIYGLGCPTCGLQIDNIEYKYQSKNDIIIQNELLEFIENEPNHA